MGRSAKHGRTSLRERFSSWTSTHAGAPVYFATWDTRAPRPFSLCFAAFVAAAAGEEWARTGTAAAPALEGIERLNTTLFARVAGLTFDRLRWVDEDEKADLRDRDGFPRCTT